MVAFSEQAKIAVPMPNIPEMQAIWTPGGNVITALTAGTVDPKAAGDQIVQQIKEGIDQTKIKLNKGEYTSPYLNKKN